MYLSFYSKLVRLEVTRTPASENPEDRFLFQTGAIRSEKITEIVSVKLSFYSKLVRLEGSFDDFLIVLSVGFYSKLVRLEAVSYSPISISPSLVSIPNWCD